MSSPYEKFIREFNGMYGIGMTDEEVAHAAQSMEDQLTIDEVAAEMRYMLSQAVSADSSSADISTVRLARWLHAIDGRSS